MKSVHHIIHILLCATTGNDCPRRGVDVQFLEVVSVENVDVCATAGLAILVLALASKDVDTVEQILETQDTSMAQITLAEHLGYKRCYGAEWKMKTTLGIRFWMFSRCCSKLRSPLYPVHTAGKKFKSQAVQYKDEDLARFLATEFCTALDVVCSHKVILPLIQEARPV